MVSDRKADRYVWADWDPRDEIVHGTAQSGAGIRTRSGYLPLRQPLTSIEAQLGFGQYPLGCPQAANS